MNFQTVGEITTLITIDFFLIFRVVTVEDNFVLGYATIGFIAFYVLVCAAYIMWDIITESRSSLIRFLAMRKYKVQRRNLGIILHATRRQRIKNFLMRRKLTTFHDGTVKMSVEMVAYQDQGIESWSSSSDENKNSDSWATCSDDSGLEEPTMLESSDYPMAKADSPLKSLRNQAQVAKLQHFALQKQQLFEQITGNALLNGKSIGITNGKSESSSL